MSIKVLHINYNYMGKNKVHKELIRHLSEIPKLENSVFAPVSSLQSVANEKNVKAPKCFNMLDHYLFFPKERKMLKAAEKSFKVQTFDLIHSYTLFVDGNAARRLSRKYNTPYIVTIRNTDINAFLKYKKYLKPLARAILKNASKIIFLSKPYKQQISKLLYKGAYPHESKTVVIPNGLDDFWIENRYKAKKQIKKDDIKVLYVGNVERNKNICTTQKALTMLRNSGIKTHLTVVGPKKEQREYKRVIKDNNTTYYDAMKKEDLIKIYRDNDIFVMPSHSESFGMVYIEAMSQGLPVIYTKGQGFDGQFKEGEVGYHVRDNSPRDIAKAILRIIGDFDTVSRSCRELCLKYNWPTICEKYEDVYESIRKKDAIDI